MENSSEIRDYLEESLQLCRIHIERMGFAWDQVKKHFPINTTKYHQLLPEELSFIDQLIFRFSKLQDTMGVRLFPSLLSYLGEDIQGKPFIDQLTKLEELSVIPSSNEWLLLRETRNIVIHEYPFNAEEVIDGLNLLSKHYILLINIWNQVESYIKNRINH